MRIDCATQNAKTPPELRDILGQRVAESCELIDKASIRIRQNRQARRTLHLLSIVWKVIQSEIVSGLTNKANVTKTNVKESSMLEYLPISPSTQCARPPAKTIHPIDYPSEF